MQLHHTRIQGVPGIGVADGIPGGGAGAVLAGGWSGGGPQASHWSFRLVAMRASIARSWAAFRFSGTGAPVPKYILSGVCPLNAECGSANSRPGVGRHGKARMRRLAGGA